ncbi:MAG: AgmX/PglI C-terminal domain-containing protein [Deltaproteobacteria bacterium]|nr:AgmX/PglI C-terminal domain-containing protein [Deltaproteobacteria bacterium]
MRGLAKSEVLTVTLALASAAVLGACKRETPPPPSPDPSASAQPPEPLSALTAPGGASPDARRARVLRLLAGGEAATALPLVDVSEGKTFEPALRDRVAPMVDVPRVKIRMGETKVVGDLPHEVVQRVVRQNFGRFRLCYEKGLERDSELAGEIVLEFTINPAGTAQVSKAGGTMKDTAVVDCVRESLGAVTFPERRRGDVQVTFPVRFLPE